MKTLQDQTTSQQSMWNYFCLEMMAMKTQVLHIVVGCYLLDVRNTIPRVGRARMNSSVHECSCRSFGLLKCGCSCVRPQRGE